jgi:hypothetical protein
MLAAACVSMVCPWVIAAPASGGGCLRSIVRKLLVGFWTRERRGKRKREKKERKKEGGGEVRALVKTK